MSDEPDDREEDPPTDFLSALRPGETSPAAPPESSDKPSIDELDPDVAIVETERSRPPRTPPPVIDTRKYQFIIGAVGLTIFLVLSALLFIHHKSGLPGYAKGQRMHEFVAPLAISDLGSVSANANPACNPARPSRRGLNICNRKPTVLAFFHGSGTTNACIKEVDALQTESSHFPGVLFAAVDLNTSKATAAQAVRQNHWTIPIAYDLNDTIGEVYGVEVCPMVEIAKAGGKVTRRLIGDYWEDPAQLAKAVDSLGVR